MKLHKSCVADSRLEQKEFYFNGNNMVFDMGRPVRLHM